jgi:hypothetical protein
MPPPQSTNLETLLASIGAWNRADLDAWLRARQPDAEFTRQAPFRISIRSTEGMAA